MICNNSKGVPLRVCRAYNTLIPVLSIFKNLNIAFHCFIIVNHYEREHCTAYFLASVILDFHPASADPALKGALAAALIVGSGRRSHKVENDIRLHATMYVFLGKHVLARRIRYITTIGLTLSSTFLHISMNSS